MHKDTNGMDGQKKRLIDDYSIWKSYLVFLLCYIVPILGILYLIYPESLKEEPWMLVTGLLIPVIPSAYRLYLGKHHFLRREARLFELAEKEFDSKAKRQSGSMLFKKEGLSCILQLRHKVGFIFSQLGSHYILYISLPGKMQEHQLQAIEKKYRLQRQSGNTYACYQRSLGIYGKPEKALSEISEAIAQVKSLLANK